MSCLASLRAAAEAARAAGDPRTQGQVMADALVARVTGAEHPGELPVELQVVITDEALLADLIDPTGPQPPEASTEPPGAAAEPREGCTEPPAATTEPRDVASAEPRPAAEAPEDIVVPDADAEMAGGAGVGRDAPGSPAEVGAPIRSGRSGVAFGLGGGQNAGGEPAVVVGYGPIPAATARDWLREGLDGNGRVWIRRLLTDPVSGQATAIDARARLFPPPLRRLILARDQFCRTPFCGAPIRHIDHAHSHAAGGATSVVNGQGLCERCNQAKTAPGWAARAVPDPGGLDRHVIETRTPTGHRYTSTAPPVLPTTRPRRPTTPAAALEAAPARAG